MDSSSSVLACHLVGVLGAAGLRQRQPDQIIGRDLRQECLGRCHPDLGPGAGVEHRVALARDLATVGVADRQHLGLLLLGVPHRLEGVGGLAGLRYRNYERATVQNRVAVAEFTGQLDLDRQPRPVLDRVLGQQSGVVGRAAGHDEDLVDLAQLLVGEPLLVEHDAAIDEVAQQGFGYRGRLLGDLLEHEVLIAALFGSAQVPVDIELAVLDILATVEVGDLVAVGGDHHGLVLAQLDGMAGVFDKRRDIGAHEHLAVADTQHQRRRSPGGDDGAGIIDIEEHQREVTLEAAQHRQHRSDEVTGGRAMSIGPGDQMHGDLGVGVARKIHPGRLEFTAQRGEVFDDPVVHDRDLGGGVAMRVRVAVGGPSMRGPAGMTQPGVSAQRNRIGLVQRGLQVDQPAGAPTHRKSAVAVD